MIRCPGHRHLRVTKALTVADPAAVAKAQGGAAAHLEVDSSGVLPTAVPLLEVGVVLGGVEREVKGSEMNHESVVPKSKS